MNGISSFLMTDVFVPLLNSLWQAAAICVLASLVMRFPPRVNAATRYAIWWALLGVVLLLPLAPALPERSQPAAAVVRSSTGSSINPLLPQELKTSAIVNVRPASTPKWPVALAALWALLFFYRLASVARSFRYLRNVKARAIASAESLPPTGREARLLISNEISSPIAVGFSKPAVILPETFASLEKAEIDHVLLHESAHLARWDDWTNLAARLLEAFLALHPVVLWILHRIEREREIACDEWVVARTGQARDYAASLARMHEMRWPGDSELLASGVFGRGSRLAERIELLVERGREFSGRVSARRVLVGTAFLLALAAAGSRFPRWIAFAQQSPRPSFDVASLKPGVSNSRFGVGVQGALFVANNAPLSILVGFAYDVQLHQIFGGPKWMNTDRFTIEARAPIPGPPERMNRIRLMVQSLLEERFRLALHRETRTGQIYELAIAKGGPKLKETASPDPTGRTGIFAAGRPGEMDGYDVGIAELVGILSQRLGSPVIDKTGLAGKYDFKLSFMPEPTQQDLALFGPQPPDAVPVPDSGLPSIFTAVQEQLGLKLEAARGPVEVLVIDRAEKPDPN